MNDAVIELRSDTFTQPTPGMREAIATADVGDDMFGEDPTVNRLEARMAELFGMEAAVFACSGTQSNQMGVWSHCERGSELLIESTGHIGNYEAGGPAILSGVSVRMIRGDAGRLDVSHIAPQVRYADQHFPPTRLLCLENSTNLGGGRTYTLDHLERVCGWAHENGWKTHLDGARIFNACIAQGYSPADVGAQFDTISICFSKGLGCPMGSVLVGSADAIARARRARKIFGGAMRQAGMMAAAAIYALDHHVDRLADDHAHARLMAEQLADVPGLTVDLATVETNLLFFELDPAYGTGRQLADALHTRGVRLHDVANSNRLRACTHLDVSRDQVLQAARIIREVVPNLRDAPVATESASSAY